MKALAGMLLAFALAAGIGNQADAQQCASKHTSKQVTRTSRTSHSIKKCVCSVHTTKTTGMLKTKSYGGYKHVNSVVLIPDNNSSDFDSTKIVPLDGGNIDKAQ